MERAATAEEAAQVAALIGEAVDAGALGFSSTTLNQHMGFEGKPLACRNASREEMSLRQPAHSAAKGAIEIALTARSACVEQDRCTNCSSFLLEESGRPVTFIALFDHADLPKRCATRLRRAAPMIAKGAQPQASPLPLTRECNMDNHSAFAAFPSWKTRVLGTARTRKRRSTPTRPSAISSATDLKRPTGFGDWRRMVVHNVNNPALQAMELKSMPRSARRKARTWYRRLPRSGARRQSRGRTHHPRGTRARGRACASC